MLFTIHSPNMKAEGTIALQRRSLNQKERGLWENILYYIIFIFHILLSASPLQSKKIDMFTQPRHR